MFFALELYNPMVLIYVLSFVSPNLTISFGELILLNNFLVALLTDMSVDCAERITATRNVKLFLYFSSLCGRINSLDNLKNKLFIFILFN